MWNRVTRLAPLTSEGPSSNAALSSPACALPSFPLPLPVNKLICNLEITGAWKPSLYGQIGKFSPFCRINITLMVMRQAEQAERYDEMVNSMKEVAKVSRSSSSRRGSSNASLHSSVLNCRSKSATCYLLPISTLSVLLVNFLQVDWPDNYIGMLSVPEELPGESFPPSNKRRNPRVTKVTLVKSNPTVKKLRMNFPAFVTIFWTYWINT